MPCRSARISRARPTTLPSKPQRACSSSPARSADSLITLKEPRAVPGSRVPLAAAAGAAKRMLCHSDPLDLPLEIDAGMLLDAPAHRLAQRFDVGGAGAAEIDEQIAVHLRHRRVAHLQAAAARRVDELPGFVTGGILEGRAAGAALDRLGCLARFRDFVHLGGDLRRVAGGALEQCLREDDVVGRAATAIAVLQIAIAEYAQAALPIDAACLDQRVLGLAAVGAAVHAQRPAHGAGDPTEEGEAGNRRLLRGAADFNVGRRRAGADTRAVLDPHLAEATTET